MRTVNDTTSVGRYSRLEHIDGLRALAAVYVTLHYALLYVNDDLTAGLARKTRRLLLFGHYAVVQFIVLSGYCLMLPVIKHGGILAGGTWHFLLKRAWRILPPYYFAILFSHLLISLMIGHPQKRFGMAAFR